MERIFCSVATKNVYSARVTTDAHRQPWDLLLSYWNGEKWIVIDVWNAGLITVDEFVQAQLKEGI